MKVSVLAAPALIAVLVGTGLKPTATLERSGPSVEHGSILTAIRTTEAAHRRAVRDGRWEALIDVGDAYQRIAGRAGAPGTMSQRAHDAYAAALQSARRAESLDGVLRAAEAFAQLGDAHEVELSLLVARDVAGSDPESAADVRAVAVRLSDLLEPPRAEVHVDD